MSSMANYHSFCIRLQQQYSRIQSGFTLIELMVGIAIVAILISVGLPSLNQFTLQMRVDNEISAMHRLLLTARNAAINNETNVTVCPLQANNKCGNDWTGQISVFTNTAINTEYNATTEQLITVKDAIKDNDQLTFAANSFVYSPSGQLANSNIGLIAYCPYGQSNYNRGIVVSASGRIAASSDTNNDGKDETRAGGKITCS